MWWARRWQASYPVPDFGLSECNRVKKEHTIVDKDSIYFQRQAPEYESFKQLSGIGRCPYDPDHNSTAIFSGKFKISEEFLLEMAVLEKKNAVPRNVYLSHR